LPDFDDSAKIIYEYYRPGEELPAEQKADVLAFNMPSSYAGQPVRLASLAHQRLKSVDAGTKVLARHENDEPAVTFRKHGEGVAIFLNVQWH